MLIDFEVEYENKYLFEFYDWADKNAAPMGNVIKLRKSIKKDCNI